VVSIVPFSHAAPAAHIRHNVSRNNYDVIARKILTVVKPDVVIGGGHPLYLGNYGYIPLGVLLCGLRSRWGRPLFGMLQDRHDGRYH